MPEKTPQKPTFWKMPPLVKVYEALGAIADGRVRLIDEQRAHVTSSEGSKIYAVDISGKAVSANDNASYWQGYLGYPAIAVMVVRGILTGDEIAAEALKAVPWKELNRRFHNDYVKTLAEVAALLHARGVDPSVVESACINLLDRVREFAPIRGQRRRPADD